ncbi:MAG: hypothetical protein H6865_02410 [Rhodospirillales bacterium]|nr:hypothetical protein [Alphaproteobacteria bacterium]MCB9986468.1 hypothetical protein [Rhodospirillales bacterium]USO06987.1 MAG: hypothetical protein H6866_05975 [Rhodospirillales bacterium]
MSPRANKKTADPQPGAIRVYRIAPQTPLDVARAMFDIARERFDGHKGGPGIEARRRRLEEHSVLPPGSIVHNAALAGPYQAQRLAPALRTQFEIAQKGGIAPYLIECLVPDGKGGPATRIAYLAPQQALPVVSTTL